MQNKLRISLVDEMNNIIEEISHMRPYNFDELIIILKKNFKNLPKNFNIYYKEKKQEITINNDEEYQLSKDILYIKEIKDLNK